MTRTSFKEHITMLSVSNLLVLCLVIGLCCSTSILNGPRQEVSINDPNVIEMGEFVSEQQGWELLEITKAQKQGEDDVFLKYFLTVKVDTSTDDEPIIQTCSVVATDDIFFHDRRLISHSCDK